MYKRQVMGIVGIASSFYAKQSIISVAVALIPGIVLMAAAFLTGEQIGLSLIHI